MTLLEHVIHILRAFCTMSSKLVKSQLNSVLRAIDKKQQGGGKKGGAQQGSGGRKAKRGRQAKRQGTAPEEQDEKQRTAVLAANLRYFAKTTAAKGKAQDLVTQVRHCMPLPATAAACRLLPSDTALLRHRLCVPRRATESNHHSLLLPCAAAHKAGFPAAAPQADCGSSSPAPSKAAGG